MWRHPVEKMRSFVAEVIDQPVFWLTSTDKCRWFWNLEIHIACNVFDRNETFDAVRRLFFQLSKCLEGFTQWIGKYRRADKANANYVGVCSIHFTRSQYKRDLKYLFLNLLIPANSAVLKAAVVPNAHHPSPCRHGTITRVNEWACICKAFNKFKCEKK